MASRLTYLLAITPLLALAVTAAETPPTSGARLVEKENIVESARATAKWMPAAVGLELALRDRVRTGELSRAALQYTDLSVVRLDELTTLEVEPPRAGAAKGTLDLKSGGAYFFSREKSAEVQVRTPAATGALKGTQLIVRVTPLGKTLLTMLEGEVVMSNPQGTITLHSGEQGEAVVGQAPHKTAVIDAINLVQWALYYPGVLNPDELHLSSGEAGAVQASLAAYRSGDLLGSLSKYPAGHHPASAAAKLYRAAVLLAVGRVDDASRLLRTVPSGSPQRQALEKMIAAVQFREVPDGPAPATAGEWMAESYYRQSRSDLEKARDAARHATEVAPGFGYGWVRLAEMEFSFGRIPAALKSLDQGLALTPRNAQAHSLRGFLLSAQNSIGPARASFEEAIALDGALGNAWLGRGLTYIRQGKETRGREDLQIAATLEPNRSILHSYLGKAFTEVGDTRGANLDLKRARELDPRDPTPWLYSALEDKAENRYNQSVGDLEKSLALNDNRSVYRSRFLLDQDKGVRNANLAAIYRNDGMIEQSVRQAVQAVDADYSSASAHLFLSNSFDALRDPRRVQLRFETAWFNELLLSNLLAPVGGGSLSQFVSQQEYSKLFEADGFGISSTSDYFSYGEFRETGSQFGTFGNFSYALDTQYLWEHGFRTNSSESSIESYGTFKYQLTPQDTVFFKVKYEDLHTGNIFNSYDPRESALSESDRTVHFHEQQEPALALLGYHHEWAPGIHTLFLAGRLANEQTLTSQKTSQTIVTRDLTGVPRAGTTPQAAVPGAPTFPEIASDLSPFLGQGSITGVNSLPFDFGYAARFEIYTGELQQIVEAGPMTFVGGLRYQKGRFTTSDQLDAVGPAFANITSLFDSPAAREAFTVDFERLNLYAYDTWHVTPWLSITGGVTWDKLTYPANFRSPPVSSQSKNLDKVSPKIGFILHPTRDITLRGAYTRGNSGASFDESIRLEPTQVAGFNQAYRTLISEDIIGAIAGSAFQTYNLSLEYKLPSKTYFGVEANLLQQKLDREVGTFDFLQDPRDFTFSGVLPSELHEKFRYHEQDLTASINQLIGRDWSLGARLQYTRSVLHSDFTEIPGSVLPEARQRNTSGLYTTSLFALYNHPSGFFARAEANWYKQNNTGYAVTPSENPQVGDDFWQLNALAGWRFYRNQCELSVGVLNIAGRNYRLEPLNPYFELPRERTLVVHCKLNF